MRLRADPLSRAESGSAAEESARVAGPRVARRAGDVGALLALPALVALLYHAAARLWWLSDDFFNVLYVREWRPAQYCLDPAVWQRLPFRMLTPLEFVSFDADLSLFGVDPRAFHLHELISTGLVGVALFLLLRLWLPTVWSLTGAALSLIGVPMVAIAPYVMVRHYPEALVLAIASAIGCVVALRARRPSSAWILAIVSAALWFAAAIAKEIAVPLIVLFPFFPEATLRTRLQRLCPHAAAACLYLAYRRYLMGAWVGGYGWIVEDAASRWRLAARLPWRLAQELAGGSPAGWLALSLALVGVGLCATSGRRAALLVGVGLLVVAVPLLPVSTEVVARYAMAPWVAIAVAFVFGAHRVPSGAWLAAAACAVTLVANRQAWRTELAGAQRESVENRALVTLGRGDVLRLPSGPPAALEQAHRFAREVEGHDAAAWYLDEIFLCLDHRVDRLWQYDEASKRVVEVTGRLPALRHAHCGAIRPRRPLTADISFDDGAVLRWKLGPYEEGRWSFVLRDGVDAYPVPRSGAFQLAPLGSFPLRVRYDSPAGWTTYSPALPLELGSPRRWQWSRPTTRARGSS